MTQANWLESFGFPMPERLSLRSVDAWNMGEIAESRIREGYTKEEIRAGVTPMSPETLLKQWVPTNARSVALGFCLAIGWDDDPGVDNFDVYVITNSLRHTVPRWKPSLIYVDTFEWESVLEGFLNIIKKCEANTWDESVQRLKKRFDWEYEDMASFGH